MKLQKQFCYYLILSLMDGLVASYFSLLTFGLEVWWNPLLLYHQVSQRGWGILQVPLKKSLGEALALIGVGVWLAIVLLRFFERYQTKSSRQFMTVSALAGILYVVLTGCGGAVLYAQFDLLIGTITRIEEAPHELMNLMGAIMSSAVAWLISTYGTMYYTVMALILNGPLFAVGGTLVGVSNGFFVKAIQQSDSRSQSS